MVIAIVGTGDTVDFLRSRLNDTIGRWNNLGTYDAIAIIGGTINGATVGLTTPLAGKFTDLTITGTANFSATTLVFGSDQLSGDYIDGGTISNATILLAGAPTVDLHAATKLYVDSSLSSLSLGSMATQASSAVTITGGTITGTTINNTTIGASTPASGRFTTLTATDAVSFTSGTITGTTISGITLSGTSSPTLAVTGTSSISGANTGDQTITLTGDVTGSGTGSFAATIGAGSVTYAKIQNVSAQYSILARTSAGAGSVQELASSAPVHTFLGQTTQALMRTTGLGINSASSSAEGLVELTTDAEFKTGTDTTRAITTANVKAGLGVTKYYESAETATSTSYVEFTHSLGTTPKMLIVEFVCRTTNNGWAVGDRLIIGSRDGGYGMSVGYNATKIFIRPDVDGFYITSKTTGEQVGSVISSGDWKFVVRAWA